MRRIKSLTGKMVLLTGAAGGIGSALAKKLFFQEGASLLLVDKNVEKLKELRKEFTDNQLSETDRRAESEVHIFKADLSSSASLEQLCEAIGKFEVDILINNVGIMYAGPFKDMDLDDFAQVLNVNLMSIVHLTHSVLPKIIARKGFIVNVSSGAGLSPFPGLNAYTTSKFGLVGFSEGLRSELDGLVGVSTICPAFVATDIAKSSLLSSRLGSKQQIEKRDRLDQMIRQLGMDPSRVADIIIKSIKKGRGLVSMNLVTRFMYTLRILLPSLQDRLNASFYRRMVGRGLSE